MNFQIFKNECKLWLDKFEINMIIDFIETTDIPSDARVSINKDITRATIKYNPVKNHTSERVKELAKHEVIHLLVAELSGLSSNRYISESELLRAKEGLVCKLAKLL